MIDDTTGKRKVFVQESWTSNSGAGRLCHNTRLWDYDKGTLIATTLQDGMMRVLTNGWPRVFDGDDLSTLTGKL